jgi:hypothetical protein
MLFLIVESFARDHGIPGMPMRSCAIECFIAPIACHEELAQICPGAVACEIGKSSGWVNGDGLATTGE